MFGSIKSKVWGHINAKIKEAQKAHDERVAKLKSQRRIDISMAHTRFHSEKDRSEEEAIGSILNKIL